MAVPGERVIPGRRTDAPVIVAPTQFAVTDAELLRIDTWTYVDRSWVPAPPRYDVSARHLKPDGTDQISVQTVGVQAGQLPRTTYLDLERGALQTVTLRYAGGSFPTSPGITYAKVDLIRGTAGSAQTVLATLLAGYAGPGQALSWPGSPVQSPFDGPGYTVFGEYNPLSGNADLAWPFPYVNMVLKVTSVGVRFRADANVANRRVRLFLQTASGANTRLWSASMDVTAGQTVDLNWIPGAAYSGGVAGSDASAPMPADIIMRFGDMICTSTLNLQVGDAFQLVNWTAQAYMEPQP